MTSREDIIERIRKLSKMTTENGCSEAEAHAANAKLAALIEEWNVEQDELSLRRDAQGCVVDEFIELKSKVGEWTRVAPAISKLFSVRCWVADDRQDILGLGIPMDVVMLKFYGYPQDVAAAVAMTSICHNAIATEGEYWRKHNKGNRRSFDIGMATRLAERIKEMMPKMEQSTGKALVPLKNQLVNQEFKAYCRANGLRLQSMNRKGITDHNAAAAGRAAANKVDLGGTKLNTGPKMIGRS